MKESVFSLVNVLFCVTYWNIYLYCTNSKETSKSCVCFQHSNTIKHSTWYLHVWDRFYGISHLISWRKIWIFTELYTSLVETRNMKIIIRRTLWRTNTKCSTMGNLHVIVILLLLTTLGVKSVLVSHTNMFCENVCWKYCLFFISLIFMQIT